MEKYNRLETICKTCPSTIEAMVREFTPIDFDVCDMVFTGRKIKFKIYDFSFASGNFPIVTLLFTPVEVAVDISGLDYEFDINPLKAEWLKFYYSFKQNKTNDNHEEENLGYEE